MSSFPLPSDRSDSLRRHDGFGELLASSQAITGSARAVSREFAAVGVGARLAALAARRGAAAAYLDAASGATLTWSHAAQQAEQWSGQLRRGAAVGLCLQHPLTFCAAYLAALAAGVCVAPLDPRSTPMELANLLELFEITEVVVDGEETAARFDGVAVNLWMTTATGLQRTRRVVDPGPPAPGIAVMLPTSGTTGRPKIVPLTEAQLLRVARAIVSHHQLSAIDRGYSPLPLFHINAQVVGVLSTLVAGASLVVEDRFHRSSFWPTAEGLAVSWANLVPAILGVLAEEPAPSDRVRERVRFARSASAPLPVATLERFVARTGVGVLETYGMTEAASQIAANPLLAAKRRAGSVGQPVGVEMRIVNDCGMATESDEIGAVEIRGHHVVDCYLGPSRVPLAARASDGWLATGDYGRRDADGFVYLVGRTDDVINRGGEKCYPREIEEVLSGDHRVQAAVVVGRPHALLGEEPVAYVVLHDRVDAEQRARCSAELLARCQAVLSRYKQPNEVVFLESLPVGATGKVARTRLREIAAMGRPRAGAVVPDAPALDSRVPLAVRDSADEQPARQFEQTKERIP